MRSDGILSIDVNSNSHAVVIVYERDTYFEVDEITAYVDDMCGGRSRDIKIFEGDVMTIHLAKLHENWIDIAGRAVNGI